MIDLSEFTPEEIKAIQVETQLLKFLEILKKLDKYLESVNNLGAKITESDVTTIRKARLAVILYSTQLEKVHSLLKKPIERDAINSELDKLKDLIRQMQIIEVTPQNHEHFVLFFQKVNNLIDEVKKTTGILQDRPFAA
jgi:hypothetical protein